MSLKYRSIILALISVVCWATLATLGKLLIHLPPFYILGLGFLVGSLFGIFKLKKTIGSFKVMLVGVGGYFLYHFFLFLSFRYVPAIEANLINYLWPILMVLLTPYFFSDSKIGRHHVIGGILAILGCIILVLPNLNFSNQGKSFWGYLLAFGAALLWPLYSLMRKKLPNDSVFIVSGFCFGTGILCLLSHQYFGPPVSLEWRDACLILAMGIFPFGIAFYTWDLAMQLGDSRLVGAIAYLTPLLSTLCLIFFGGEQLTMSSFLAMFLILIGASTGLLDLRTPKI